MPTMAEPLCTLLRFIEAMALCGRLSPSTTTTVKTYTWNFRRKEKQKRVQYIKSHYSHTAFLIYSTACSCFVRLARLSFIKSGKKTLLQSYCHYDLIALQ